MAPFRPKGGQARRSAPEGLGKDLREARGPEDVRGHGAVGGEVADALLPEVSGGMWLGPFQICSK